MFIYFFFFVWVLLFVVNPKLQKNKQMRNIMFFCVGLFLCTSYMAGADWRNYEPSFERIAKGASNVDDRNVEYGYLIISSLFAKIGIDFWYFFIGVKLCCYYFIIRTIKRYTNGRFGWAFLFFYSYLALFYFIDCPFRNLIAATIFLFALDALISKKWKRFCLFVIISSSIHISTLFFVPFILIISFKESPLSKYLFVSVFVGLYLVFFFLIQMDLLLYLQIAFESVLGDMKNINYLIQQGRTFSVGMIVITIFFLYVIYSIDTQKLSSKEIKLYNFSILYLVFYISGYFIPISGRFSMFGYMPFICVLSLGVNQLLEKQKNLISVFACFLFVVFLGNAIRNNISKDYRYIPYTSYLQYLFQEKPSYNERANYNMVKSPYKDNEDAVFELRE